MAQKIITHLWFDKEAEEAAQLYTSLFADSHINNTATLEDTPSGDAGVVSFVLSGQEFMAISAGPYFKFNPSISLFATFDNEEDIKKVWDTLIVGGKVMMAYDTYPWAHKYGWLEDKYGLSWQLSWSDKHDAQQKIAPLLMFTKDMAGHAKDAIAEYTAIFPNSKTEMIATYTKDDDDTEGFIKHAEFTLNGQRFMAMESTLQHDFKFNEAISFVINCDTQKEIDYYWEKLSAVPEAEQCGWVKDKFGVSWQIVPTIMQEMMTSKDKEQVARVTQAFLKMKKFDIQTLQDAFKG